MTQLQYTLICVLFLVKTNFSQNNNREFEGTITYKIEYFDKNGKTMGSMFKKPIGDTVTTFIKGGNYAQFYSNSSLKWVKYLSEGNKYYSSFNNRDTIDVRDYQFPTSPIVSFGKIDTTEKILNRVCKGYKVLTPRSYFLFFYDESLFLNSTYFVNHKESGYNHYTEDTKSIYLKLIVYYPLYHISFTAIKIDQSSVENSIFLIPKKPLLNLGKTSN